MLLPRCLCIFTGSYRPADSVELIPPVTHCLLEDWVLNFGCKFATVGASRYPAKGIPEYFSYLGLSLPLLPFSATSHVGVHSCPAPLGRERGRDPQLRV